LKLSEILSEANVIPFALLDDEVTSIAQDSRLIQPGGLFVCNPGTSTDSHQYLESAEANGATAAAVWSMAGFEKAKELGLAGFVLHEERIHFNDAICRICNVMFRYPTRNMKVLGVTGTNGKTTTAWLIRDMLTALGLKAGYLGTLGFQIPGEERELGNTTPYPVELWSLLAEARDKGVEAMAIEVSSHALAEHRSEFVEFDVGVFTNLTQDHLDFHGTMDEYASAKFRLFNELPSQTEKLFVGALNLDDAYGRKWYRELVAQGGSPRAFSTYMDDDLPGNPYDRLVGIPRDIRLDGLEMEFHLRGEQVQVPLSLGGSYNVENSIAATAAVCFLEYSLQEAARAISKARPVPGRFEPVPNERGIKILVDYAHTPDALEKLLDTVRLLAKGKVITVFGCGGDRDRTKRPKMAKAASERSDLTVITSDNPRTEDPQSILDEVLTGIVPGRNSVDIIDRRDAIAYAVKEAEPGDVVVIAGKGHENYQIIGRTKYPMDDREMAHDALSRR
jgi:UDP-N-acetylmuramoyl-L-alanyl-D-glutamate--2,6-diaminopimelate ligase